jgi:hypothetical protein
MGAGLAQIGVLIVLTVIGLPLFFFGLMAALDRFERSLSDTPRDEPSVTRLSLNPIIATDAVVATPPSLLAASPGMAATAAAAAGAAGTASTAGVAKPAAAM